MLPLILALAIALGSASSLAEPVRDPLAGTWTVRGHQVLLPHVVNATGFMGRAGLASYRGSVATYRKRFSVPADGVYVISFGSVHHRATVRLDGRVVRRHTGAYLPFQARVRLTAGRTHTLGVRADWRDPTAMKHAGWHRSWFNFGGIDRPVTMLPAGPSDIVAPGIRTHLTAGGDAIVDVWARLRNHGARRSITLTGSLGDVPLRFSGVEVPAGGSRAVRTQVRVSDPALWGPGHPSLYDLQLGVAGEAS